MTPILPTPSSHLAPRPTGREERKEKKGRKKERKKRKEKKEKKKKKKVNHPFIAHSRSTRVYHLTH
jgi:hypothetical protein